MPNSSGEQDSSEDPPIPDHPMEPPPGLRRSEKYYFADGTKIFQVENTLYNLHLGLLCTRFDVFDGMFTPAGTCETLQVGLTGEGTSDDAPIVIESPWAATEEEFNYLMDYTYNGGEYDVDPSLAKLLAVKKLSAQWDNTSGQNWALSRLRAMEKRIPVSLRLRIARAFEMEDWIVTCVRELIRKPLTRLKPQDVKWLGPSVYVFLARAREQYHSLRRTVGMAPPSFEPVIDCQAHDACLKGWRYAWFTEISMGVLHPEMTFEMGFWELEDRIEGMNLTGLMGKGCGAKAKAKALESAGMQSEHALLTQATIHLAQKVPVESLDGICTTWEEKPAPTS